MCNVYACVHVYACIRLLLLSSLLMFLNILLLQLAAEQLQRAIDTVQANENTRDLAVVLLSDLVAVSDIFKLNACMRVCMYMLVRVHVCVYNYHISAPIKTLVSFESVCPCV